MEPSLRARRRDTRDPHDPNNVPNTRHERHSPKLLTWTQLPEWAQDNEYIQIAYRPISNSYRACLLSISHMHNETGNIYTHLLATAWMLAVPIYLRPRAQSHYPTANADDGVIFGLFFLGGAVCFSLSTAYHLVSSHSHAVHDVYHRLDLLGISAVTAGCFPPGMWYTFPCLARDTKIFWISVRTISVLMRGGLADLLPPVPKLDLIAQLLAAIVVLFVPRFRRPSFRHIRGILFSFMASSAFYPIVYACFIDGYSQTDVEAGANRYVFTVVTYVSAVTIYAVSNGLIIRSKRD